MRYLLTVLLITSCFGQTATKAKVIPSTLKSQLAAETARANNAAAAKALATDALIAELAKDARLEAENKELSARNADLNKQIEEAKKLQTQASLLTDQLQWQQKQTMADHTALIARYNALLDAANRQVSNSNERLARQQKIALAGAAFQPIAHGG